MTTAICYIIFLTIVPVAIFVANKLTYKLLGASLLLIAVPFEIIQYLDFYNRTKNIYERLLERVAKNELHEVERKYKCCGITGYGEYSKVPESCCGEVFHLYFCPYVIGCKEPYYYWESLSETWRGIGDIVRLGLITAIATLCFILSMKEEIDDEDYFKNRSTIMEEDNIWSMVERNKSSSESDKRSSESTNLKAKKMLAQLKIVEETSSILDVGRHEKCGSSCDEVQMDKQECSLEHPELCRASKMSVTTNEQATPYLSTITENEQEIEKDNTNTSLETIPSETLEENKK